MTITCRPLGNVPEATLDRLTGDAFFASRIFAGLWRARGAAPVVWCAQEGQDLLAVLPGVVLGRGPLQRFMSMPDGCYGGVFIAPAASSERERLTAALLDAIVAAGYLKTFLFDFDGHLGRDDRFTVQPLETTLVDISAPGWGPPDRKLLAQIRKAEREGIRIQPLDWARHGSEFMRLMRQTERRHHNRPRYPESFFRALALAATTDPRLHLVWCEHEGRGVCTHLYVLERGMLQGWQIYFDKAYSFLKPNQYIRFLTCREMAKRGVRTLNLGGSPENAPGLEYYKSRWGGRTLAYRMLSLRRGIGRWL